MNILSIADMSLMCFPHHILARGYTTTVADFNALFERMMAYRVCVREGFGTEKESVLRKMDSIAYYQKNRLNPFTYDIRRIKNGGIS